MSSTIRSNRRGYNRRCSRDLTCNNSLYSFKGAPSARAKPTGPSRARRARDMHERVLNGPESVAPGWRGMVQSLVAGGRWAV